MGSGIVYDGVARQESNEDEPAGAGEGPTLFSGMKMWFSHAVPQRTWLLENAKINGAQVVPLEIQADVKLVDHMRKNQAPGTHSYRFVEMSIKNGQLEDLEKHRVGTTTRVERPVGSIITAPKGERKPFTPNDDQFLWNMIKPFMDRGGSWKGNEIYKQVERINPRHTYQSWRDRWIKYVQYSNRQITEIIIPTPAQSPSRPQPSPARRPIPAPSPTPVARVVQPTQQEHPEPGPSSSPKRRKLNHEGAEGQVLSQTQTQARQYIAIKPRTEFGAARPEEIAPSTAKLRPTQPREAISAEVLRTAAKPRPAEEAIPYQQNRSLSHPSTAQQAQNAERSTKAVPTANTATPHSLPQFETDRLYQSTRMLIFLTQVDRREGFQKLAADAVYQKEHGLSGEEWEQAWKETILPRWCKSNSYDLETVLDLMKQNVSESNNEEEVKEPENEVDNDAEDDSQSAGDIVRCSKCMTEESKIWRFDKEGKPVCQDCRRLLRSGKMVRPSLAWTDGGDDSTVQQTPARSNQQSRHVARPKLDITVTQTDAAVQTSPIEPTTPPPKQHRTPSAEPEASSVFRAPGANEARKRSNKGGAQSTSQDTTQSDQRPNDADDQAEAVDEIPETAKVSQTEVLEQGRTRQTLPFSPKSRRLKDDPNSLEIPPTPEQTQTHVESFDASGNQDQSASSSTSESELGSIHDEPDGDSERDSPLFFPETRPTSGIARQPRVQFFNDIDEAAISSSMNRQAEDDENSDTGSVYNFETAPDVSQDWETAPETQNKNKGRLETQALIAEAVPEMDADEFALPAPEGGWEAIEPQSPPIEISEDEEEENETDDEGEGEAPDGQDAANLWLEEMRQEFGDEPGIEKILVQCLHATSFDFDLSKEVVERVLEMSSIGAAKERRRQGGILIPDGIAGCWTEMDDNMLCSSIGEEVDQMHRKHGEENCISRFHFLAAWQEN